MATRCVALIQNKIGEVEMVTSRTPSDRLLLSGSDFCTSADKYRFLPVGHPSASYKCRFITLASLSWNRVNLHN